MDEDEPPDDLSKEEILGEVALILWDPKQYIERIVHELNYLNTFLENPDYSRPVESLNELDVITKNLLCKRLGIKRVLESKNRKKLGRSAGKLVVLMNQISKKDYPIKLVRNSLSYYVEEVDDSQDPLPWDSQVYS